MWKRAQISQARAPLKAQNLLFCIAPPCTTFTKLQEKVGPSPARVDRALRAYSGPFPPLGRARVFEVNFLVNLMKI